MKHLSEHGNAIGSAIARTLRWLAPLLLVASCLLLLKTPTARADDPTFVSQRIFGGKVDDTTSVVVADINGDDNLDLVVGNGRGQQNVVYLNDGRSNFYTDDVTCGAAPSARCFGTGSDDTTSVAVGDMDGDGDLDLVVANYNQYNVPGFEGEQNVVYLNDGTGNFHTGDVTCGAAPSARCFGTGLDNTISVAVGDVDGDGDLDIATGNDWEQSAIYVNDGKANFSSGPITCGATLAVRCFGPATQETSRVVIGDMDDDGDLDLVVSNEVEPNLVYLNDGTGNFPAQRTFGTPTDISKSIAVGDMDGDGDLDIITGVDGGQNVVYLNEGKGTFYSGPVTCGSTQGVRCFGTGNDATQGLAVGDVDDDGDLDLVAGNFLDQSVVYLNDGQGDFNTGEVACGITPGVYCVGPRPDLTSSVSISSVALGDMDRDGDLDLVAGSDLNRDIIYLNDGSGSVLTKRTFDTGTGVTKSVAVGDVDGDGDLDLIVGHNAFGQNMVFLNDGAGQYHTGPVTCGVTQGVSCFGTGQDFTDSVAMGDVDGDGDLDIVDSQLDEQGVVWLNDGQGHFSSGLPTCGVTPGVRCFGSDANRNWRVLVGDMDGDGDLDLIVGSQGRNVVYLNDGTGSFSSGAFTCSVTAGVRCFGTGHDSGYIAVGDIDGDGDLDIVAANRFTQSVVYLNDGAANFYAGPVACDTTQGVRCFGAPSDQVESVVVGDIDGDSDLDIVAGKSAGESLIYLNDGKAYFHIGTVTCGVSVDARCFGTGQDKTTTLAVGDIDGDGDLDLVTGHKYEQNVAYLNDGAGNFLARRTIGAETDNTTSVALADIDRDSDLDFVVGKETGQNVAYLNDLADTARLANNPPRIVLDQPGPAQAADFYSRPTIFSSPIISITYRLVDRDGDQVRHIRAFYSPDGGGRWLTAVPAADTATTDLASNRTYSYKWDTFASGFFGQSDNVVFRIEAYPGIHPIPNGVPGPYQRPYASAATFPFRVRGTQVLVKRWQRPPASPPTASHHVFLPLTLNLSVGAPAALPLANAPALVYRIRPGQVGTPIANSAGQPFPTDAQGYLQGRGEIDIGDQLVALQPIAATKTYTAYLTSAAPNATGLDAFTVTSSGVQTLTISPDHPLVLFNLTISLEWDARADAQFLAELRYNLQRVSELLYDWTDGQAALGHLTIYHAKGRWDDADIRLFASNRIRPNSNLGGIAEPGNQVRVGTVWNRFGDPSGNVGEDWPRALAHELGHYALFLDDNYLGLDNGRITSISGCRSPMTDPYRDDYSELHPRTGWLAECARTLANQTTGRADWETVVGGYPWLHAPLTYDANPGPSTLPLAVTTLAFAPADTPDLPLAAPIINLIRQEDGARLVPSDRARAFLFKRTNGQDTDLVDLGRPVLDQVNARGAHTGDRLCVYDLGARDAQGALAARLGCTDLALGTSRLALGLRRDWRPDVVITPESARAITIAVPPSGVGSPQPARLQVRLFPTDLRQAPVSGALERQSDGWYRGTLTFAASQPPSLEGYVQVWVDGDATPGRAIVTDYALGGNPAPPRRPPRRARRRAPATSIDGQVILYGPDQEFTSGEFYAIQTASVLPEPPAWATFVGQGYRLIGSPGAPPLSNVTINLSYATGDVAAGTEDGVSVYYWRGTAWQRLPTERDPDGGEVIAPAQGAGLYVLMSSVEIPLTAGINMVAYPVKETRPVKDALASIDGRYTTVRWYDPATRRWLVYTAGAPDYANTLKVLEFGKGYEIQVTQDALLLLRGGGQAPATAAAQVLAQPTPFPPAPATYYGVVQGEGSFVLTPGQAVVARVDGVVCGEGRTLDVNGQVVYRIDVMADGPGVAGCGVPGRTVTFEVAGRAAVPLTHWSNDHAHELMLVVR